MPSLNNQSEHRSLVIRGTKTTRQREQSNKTAGKPGVLKRSGSGSHSHIRQKPSSTAPLPRPTIPESSSSSKMIAVPDTHTTAATDRLQEQYIRNLQQQVHLLELENEYFRRERSKSPPSVYRPQSQHISSPHQHIASNSLTQSELAVAAQQRDVALMKLTALEEKYRDEKETLSDEIIDLKKSIDDLKLELARKNAELSDTPVKRVSSAKTQKQSRSLLTHSQLRIDSTSSADGFIVNGARTEITHLNNSIRDLEQQIETRQQNEEAVKQKNLQLQQTIHESELQARKEKELGQKVVQDNERLIKENSQLTAQVAELKAQLEKLQISHSTATTTASTHLHSEFAQTRERERKLQQELSVVKKQYNEQQQRAKIIDEQLTEFEAERGASERLVAQLQSELKLLQNTNERIKAELQQARHEKTTLLKQFEQITVTISNKESELTHIRHRLQALEQYYSTLLRQWESDAAEKSREFEELAMKANELSQNLRQQSRIVTSTVSKNYDYNE